MKKIIAIVLVCVFLLSLCGCKSGDTNSDITSEKPQYISLPKVEAIEVSTNATKKGTIITDKKDFEFLSKYYFEREIDMDEFSKLVDMSKVVLIKITADMVLYLLEDGRLIEPVMSGDSGVTERTFSVYTADKKSILNKANLEALLGKYKKSNDTDKTESEDTSSKTDTDNTSSDGPTITICPPKPETKEPTLPQVKYSPTGNKKMFSDIINLYGGGFAVTGRTETEEEIIPIIRIYNDKCNLVKEHKIDLPWGFSRLIECSGGGFIALTEDMPYIIKISKDFKVEWTKEYKDPTGNASAYDIKEISPDCFVILYTDFNEENDMEHVISFFDSEGNVIEKQTFIVVESFNISGNIVADGKGGVYLFTYCNQSTVDKYKLCEKEYNREDETDAAIIHFNAERKVDWSKVVSSTKGRDWIEEAAIDQKGNFYIALGTDWKGNDKLWDMMYVDDSCGNRRMLLKLDKKGNIVYKVPLTSDAMGVDQTHGIHLNNGKVNVVGMAYYFDKYNSKYPCKKIDKEDEGDRLFVAYNLSIDDKKGKELHRDLFLNSVENEPRGSVVLKNGTVVIAGSVSAMFNSLDLTFYDDYDKFGALFIYEN